MNRGARAGSPGAALLWTCIVLCAACVIAQVQVLLLAPAWLPPMEAWHSGLLPYHLLLPAQVVLLVVMAAMASSAGLRDGGYATRHPGVATTLRVLALMYFAFMAGRLVLMIMEHDLEFWRHGAIPVAFHWVLALFLLVSGREAPPTLESFWMEADDGDDDVEAGTADYGDLPVMVEPLVHGGRFPEELRFGHAR